jgi:hypothetical protein
MSSRMLWTARVVLTGTNGESGTIDLSAQNLCSVKEIELFLGKAVKMASQLNQAHIEEMMPASSRQPFKVVG